MKRVHHKSAIRVKVFSLMVALVFYISESYCQQKISGFIKDIDTLPVAGASIIIKNSNVGTQSASDGSFSIPAKPGDVLIITSVAMIAKSVQVGEETILNITLSFAINNMEEVMVVGYGTSRRKDITGAVAKLTVKEFNPGIISNPLQQLQGKVAGMAIVQPGGDPNGDITVRIRGATSLEGQPPLLVIDGVATDDFYKSITTLNPADIQSYDILKDASSAAIYGSRGANGVILVTTKNSRTGPVSIEYNGYTGVEKISNQLNMLNAGQWRDATASMGGAGFDHGGNTDWQKAITQTAFSQSHLIGLSGGTKNLKFRGSIGYLGQEGIIINTGKEVLTARLTVNQKSVNEKLDIAYNVNSSVTKRDFLPDQASTNQARTFGAFVFSQSLGFLPVWPVYNSDGSHYIPSSNALNPVFLLDELYSKRRENFFQGSIKADYELLKGFTIGVFGAHSRGNDVYDKYWPSIPSTPFSSEASKANFNKQAFSGDIHGNYRKNFGKQSIDITGVYEYNKFVNDGFGVTARGFLVPELLNNYLSAATSIQPRDIFSYKDEVKLISFLGRAVYNFDDRYLLTTNFRWDGSSKFGPDNRWGLFPSVAFGWRVTNEKFLQNVKWLDNLKLRVSYGLTGNQENLPVNSYQLLYGPVGPYLYNGQIFQSYAVVQENNPDLKWEVRKSFNVGVDFSILSNRINGTIDVFNDNTSDMLYLYDLPQPPFLTNKVYANAANATNKGVEVTLAAAIISNENFDWSAQANFATIRNRVTNLLGEFMGSELELSNRHYGYAQGGGYSNAYISELELGYPAGVLWLPEHAGLDANGHELFNNYDAAGKFIGTSTGYSDQDRVFIDPTPDFTWGFTNNFKYKDFDLSFLLRGVQGQKIFSNTLMVFDAIINLPGINVTPNALTNGFTEQPVPSTHWIRNGSFVRMENLSIGYNFQKMKGINNLRLYLTATNLFVITDYGGIDPEIKTEGSQRYIDGNYYPKTRGLMLGGTVQF